MTNAQKVAELHQQIASINKDLADNKPGMCTYEDRECLTDNYQANLEYQEYYIEQMAEVSDIADQIATLELLPPGGQYDANPWSYEEASDEIYGVNSQGLRYVSPEVGYVDEDEEYR